MIGYGADQMGLGLGPRMTLLGGGDTAAGMTQPAAVGTGAGNGQALLAWGVLFGILVAGYLFFSPITL